MYELSVSYVYANVTDRPCRVGPEEDEIAFLQIVLRDGTAGVFLIPGPPLERYALEPEYVFREGRAIHDRIRFVYAVFIMDDAFERMGVSDDPIGRCRSVRGIAASG